MMIKKIVKYSYLCIVFSIVFSCTEPVDFDQANELEITPVVESSIIFYNATAGDFFIGGSEVSTDSESVAVSFFNDEFINDNLIKAEFVFQTENTINRRYNLQVDFLTAIGTTPIHTFTVETDASVDSQSIGNEYIEVFEGADLDNLKQTQIMRFTLTMLAGDPINTGTPGNISLKSKGIFYLSIAP